MLLLVEMRRGVLLLLVMLSDEVLLLLLVVVFVWMFPDHVLEQVFAVSLEVVILVVAVVDFSEAVHVHLAHERDRFLCVELVLARLQIGVLKLVPVQVDELSVVGPPETEVILFIVDQIPQFLREEFLVLGVAIGLLLLLLLLLAQVHT